MLPSRPLIKYFVARKNNLQNHNIPFLPAHIDIHIQNPYFRKISLPRQNFISTYPQSTRKSHPYRQPSKINTPSILRKPPHRIPTIAYYSISSPSAIQHERGPETSLGSQAGSLSRSRYIATTLRNLHTQARIHIRGAPPAGFSARPAGGGAPRSRSILPWLRRALQRSRAQRGSGWLAAAYSPVTRAGSGRERERERE